MRRRLIPLAMIAFVLAVLAYALSYQRDNPREIVATGTARVESSRPGGAAQTLRTRDVRIAGVVFKEIELPNGTWIACAGDCIRAAREAGEDFWQTQQPPRR